MATKTETSDNETSDAYAPTLANISKFLDPQLVIPMLKWHLSRADAANSESQTYAPDQLRKQLLALFDMTDMVKSSIELRKSVLGTDCDVSDLQAKMQELEKRNAAMNALPALKVVDAATVDEMKASDTFNLDGVRERFGLERDAIEALYEYAKFKIDVGQYVAASEALVAYLELIPGGSERYFRAGWGTLLALVLTGNSDTSIQMLTHLRNTIDTFEEKETFRPPEILQFRAWLAHWALFVFFQRDDAFLQICNFFVRIEERDSRRKSLLTVAQLTCPWILRYVCAAVLVENKWKQRYAVVKIAKQERLSNDPVVRLLISLCAGHDPKTAQDIVSECETALRGDFFFCGGARILAGAEASSKSATLVDLFVRRAHQLVFRTFCLTHHEVEMSKLGKELNMTFEDLEKWTVDLIQAEKKYLLNDVKIDTKKGTAVMDAKHPSIYERVMQRTQYLSSRTFDMASAIGQKK